MNIYVNAGLRSLARSVTTNTVSFNAYRGARSIIVKPSLSFSEGLPGRERNANEIWKIRKWNRENMVMHHGYVSRLRGQGTATNINDGETTTPVSV